MLDLKVLSMSCRDSEHETRATRACRELDEKEGGARRKCDDGDGDGDGDGDNDDENYDDYMIILETIVMIMKLLLLMMRATAPYQRSLSSRRSEFLGGQPANQVTLTVLPEL